MYSDVLSVGVTGVGYTRLHNMCVLSVGVGSCVNNKTYTIYTNTLQKNTHVCLSVGVLGVGVTNLCV